MIEIGFLEIENYSGWKIDFVFILDRRE